MSGEPISKSKYVVLGLHILVWGALLIVPFFLFTIPDEHFGKIGLLRCSFFTIATILHIGVFYINAYYLYPKFLKPVTWWIYIVCLIAMVIMVYWLKMLVVATWFPALAINEDVFKIAFFPTIFFVIISTIYRLIVDKVRSERLKAAQKEQQLSSELKFLRSQVSPHFLFNVLNNLVSMARHKSDQLEASLIKLSELMRYMLYESDERRVDIAREIEYLNSYIDLQRLRFEDDIKIITDIARDNSRGQTIEPMLLIPFVENAFKHGTTLVTNPFIKIILRLTGNHLEFNVVNKFSDLPHSKDSSSGIGLSNVRARLNLLYNEAYTLTVDETGDIFNVRLILELK